MLSHERFQYRREHHFEYIMEQKGVPADVRAVYVEMFTKCMAAYKSLRVKRPFTLHHGYLLARFRQLLDEDLKVNHETTGVRSSTVFDDHNLLWRRICSANDWPYLSPHVWSEWMGARTIQRCWRTRKRLQAIAAFKATLTLFCDAMAFPSTIHNEILRRYFLSQV